MGIDYNIYIFNSEIYEIKSIVNGTEVADGFDKVVICRKDHKKFEKDIDPNSDYQEYLIEESFEVHDENFKLREPDGIDEYQRTFYGICRIDWYHKHHVYWWEKDNYHKFYKKYRSRLNIDKSNVTENNSVFMLVEISY